jgi:hypothetical protein
VAGYLAAFDRVRGWPMSPRGPGRGGNPGTRRGGTGGGNYTLDRSRLPSTIEYLRALGREPKGGAEWLTCSCPNPNHKDARPSFSVNRDGGFICHGCGIKGGDSLALYHQITGAPFPDAARALGALVERGRA